MSMCMNIMAKMGIHMQSRMITGTPIRMSMATRILTMIMGMMIMSMNTHIPIHIATARFSMNTNIIIMNMAELSVRFGR